MAFTPKGTTPKTAGDEISETELTVLIVCAVVVFIIVLISCIACIVIRFTRKRRDITTTTQSQKDAPAGGLIYHLPSVETVTENTTIGKNDVTVTR